MGDPSARATGEISPWPTKERMAAILADAGLRVAVGAYSIRVVDCSHFVFQEYGGDLGNPSIDADADSTHEMMREAKLVSDALAAACVKHRLEIYDGQSSMAGYLHYAWPQDERTA